jgi:hypothetical protein
VFEYASHADGDPWGVGGRFAASWGRDTTDDGFNFPVKFGLSKFLGCEVFGETLALFIAEAEFVLLNIVPNRLFRESDESTVR